MHCKLLQATVHSLSRLLLTNQPLQAPWNKRKKFLDTPCYISKELKFCVASCYPWFCYYGIQMASGGFGAGGELHGGTASQKRPRDSYGCQFDNPAGEENGRCWPFYFGSAGTVRPFDECWSARTVQRRTSVCMWPACNENWQWFLCCETSGSATRMWMLGELPDHAWLEEFGKGTFVAQCECLGQEAQADWCQECQRVFEEDLFRHLGSDASAAEFWSHAQV